MKRRKGWYKKARIKFVNKKMFSWTFSNHKHNFHYQIQSLNSGGGTISYILKDENYQVIKAIDDLGFVKGFFKAREYVKKHSDEWCFSFARKIKI